MRMFRPRPGIGPRGLLLRQPVGMIVVRPSLAANGVRLEGWWVRGPKPKVEFRGLRPN